jgi:hypothetical protein
MSGAGWRVHDTWQAGAAAVRWPEKQRRPGLEEEDEDWSVIL